MKRVVKLTAVTNAHQLDEDLTVTLPGGDEICFGNASDWVLWVEVDEGNKLKAIVPDHEFRDKFTLVLG